jgi:hypothetical protein
MKFLTFILLIAFVTLAVQALPDAEPNPEANPGPNPKADPKANPFFFPIFRFGREGGWEEAGDGVVKPSVGMFGTLKNVF